MIFYFKFTAYSENKIHVWKIVQHFHEQKSYDNFFAYSGQTVSMPTGQTNRRTDGRISGVPFRYEAPVQESEGALDDHKGLLVAQPACSWLTDLMSTHHLQLNK